MSAADSCEQLLEDVLDFLVRWKPRGLLSRHPDFEAFHANLRVEAVLLSNHVSKLSTPDDSQIPAILNALETLISNKSRLDINAVRYYPN
jgi:hypothetical protein